MRGTDKSAYGGVSRCVLSPYVIRVIKSRTMRWAGHVARVDKKMRAGFYWANLRGRERIEAGIAVSK
jgi:hypothetical protein